jgi:hypothetical protein
LCGLLAEPFTRWMTFCLSFDLPGVDLYKAAHVEFAKYPTDEMLVHIARPTDDGVQVVEVWTSAEAFRSWMDASAGPVFGTLAAAGWTLPEVTPTPFDPTGLIISSAGIAV